MDKPDNVISLINLATVRSLEAQWGVAIDPLRFRANIYIDGAEPWEEFNWVGGEIRIGDTVFAVDRKNGRCGATNVNPATGRRDLDIPGSLRAAFGHKNLGVYLVVREGGEIAVGDPVLAPRSTPASPVAQAAAPAMIRCNAVSCAAAAISSTKKPTACRSNRSGRARRSRIFRRTGAVPTAARRRRPSGLTWKRSRRGRGLRGHPRGSAGRQQVRAHRSAAQ